MSGENLCRASRRLDLHERTQCVRACLLIRMDEVSVMNRWGHAVAQIGGVVAVEPRPQWDAEKARCSILSAAIVLPPGQRLVVYDSVRICTRS